LVRRRLVAGIGVVMAATLAAAVVPQQAQAAETSTAKRHWQSGVFTGKCGSGPVTTFGKWRGAPVERTSAYLEPTTWTQLTETIGLGGCIAGLGMPVTLSVSMLPRGTNAAGDPVVRGNMKAAATGAYDHYWTDFAERLVKTGYAGATLRVGWEMNGDWFPWSAINKPLLYKKYWRHIVTSMRAVPGAKFTFEWAPALGTTQHFNVAKAYPGDKYVTYVGSTLYDAVWGHPELTPAKRWRYLMNQDYGLRWLAKFARLHHKPLAFAEWGLASKASFSHGGGGDDPLFVERMYNFIQTHQVAYDIYFNRLHDAYDHRLMPKNRVSSKIFKQAAADYRKLFSVT